MNIWIWNFHKQLLEHFIQNLTCHPGDVATGKLSGSPVGKKYGANKSFRCWATVEQKRSGKEITIYNLQRTMDICNKFHGNPAIVEIFPQNINLTVGIHPLKRTSQKISWRSIQRLFRQSWPQSDQIFQSLWKGSYIYKAWWKIKNPAINEL